jgi:hypothetical protein
MVIAKRESRPLTVRQQKGRAVNAVAEMLERRLAVPKIYLEPPSSIIYADVLAVDRAGAGDLHAVEIKWYRQFGKEPSSTEHDTETALRRVRETTRSWLRQLLAMPAHYKYLAIPRLSWRFLNTILVPMLLSADGIGKIGIIEIVARGEEPSTAELLILPERFRVDAAKLTKIEKTLINNKKVRPDIEVRI